MFYVLSSYVLKHRSSALLLVIFFLLCYFPIFLHLEDLAIRIYDEARRGVNAIEMLENGNWLVPHYEGIPDMWGTKPPLLIWLQVLFMKLLGVNVLAVRLPSALAVLGIVLLLLRFSHTHLKNFYFGAFAGLVIITAPGYMGIHGGRTGDYDALLSLLLFAYLLNYFVFLNTKKKKYLILTALFILLAIYTKGVAGLFFLPGLLAYTIYKKQLLVVLKDKQIYVAILGVLTFATLYYIGREQVNPGYLQAVWENELGGRYLEVKETHVAPFYFYLENLWKERFTYWVYFLPFCLILLFYCKASRLRDFGILLFINSLVFLFIISFSKTKLVWYDMPLYPCFAMIISIGLLESYGRILNKFYWLPIAALCAFPYIKIVESSYFPSKNIVITDNEKYAYFVRSTQEYRNYFIANIGYNSHVKFSQMAFNRNGYELATFYPGKKMQLGQTILLCEERAKFLLHQQHEVEILKESHGCKLVQIKGYLPIY